MTIDDGMVIAKPDISLDFNKQFLSDLTWLSVAICANSN
jgi:hypothetical protein